MSATERVIRTLEEAAREGLEARRVIAEIGAGGDPRVAAIIEALLDEDRKDTLLRAEQRWFGRLGWRLSRPLIACAVVASPLFLLQNFVPPAQGLALFLVGSGLFFVLLQLYVQRWTLRVERIAADRERMRARRFEELAAELADRA